MLKIENYEVVGWEHAIRGMRNPMNSWENSDSTASTQAVEEGWFEIGPNDLDLMTRLRNAGTDHRKFMRMITVYLDITAPLYWWKEFDTYRVGVEKNSCSTMHKIHAKEFTLEDFSTEHLYPEVREAFENTIIKYLNEARKTYNFLSDTPSKKDAWWQMIQILPTSYNQRRTVMLNYEVLANIYKSRRNHKLDEWCVHETPEEHEFRNKDFASGMWGFCDWIESLPYSELITGTSLNDIPICNEIMEEAINRVRKEKK